MVDDYAHHPTEIEATLAAARLKYPGRPIWAVFQPHTYSRTATLLGGFAVAFGDADHVVVTEIYAAREENTQGVSGSDLVQLMAHPDVCYVPSLEDAASSVLERVQTGDVIITLGAGDGYLIGERVLDELRQRPEELSLSSLTLRGRDLGGSKDARSTGKGGMLIGSRNGDQGVGG